MEYQIQESILRHPHRYKILIIKTKTPAGSKPTGVPYLKTKLQIILSLLHTKNSFALNNFYQQKSVSFSSYQCACSYSAVSDAILFIITFYSTTTSSLFFSSSLTIHSVSLAIINSSLVGIT